MDDELNIPDHIHGGRKISLSRLCLLSGLLTVGPLWSGAHVHASPFQHYVRVAAGVEHDTNPAMVEDDENSVERALLTPEYQLQWKRDEHEVLADARLRLERSSDTDLSKDREDPSVSLQWTGSNPRGETWIRGKFEEASTRLTEIEDTGELRPDATRTIWTAESGIERAVSERSRLGVDLEYEDFSYDDNAFIDYTNVGAGIYYSYMPNEIFTPFVQVGAAHYDPDESEGANRSSEGSSERYALFTGAEWQLNEVLKSEFTAGAAYIDDEDSDTNWIGSLGFTYSGETSESNLKYERSTSASGVGGYVEADSVNGSITYEFSPLLTLGGSANWRNNRSGLKNETINVSLWADRDLSEFWLVRASWEFRRQESSRDADAHIFLLSLRYNVPLKS